MKIALLFSGQPRYLNDGYKTLYDNLLSKYDVDCFVHTWWDKKLAGKNVNFYNKLTYGRNCIYEEKTLETIVSLYNPKLMMYQKQKEFDIYPGDYAMANPLTTYSQWFSVLKTNELKNYYSEASGIYYDLTIRCRFDCNLIKFDIDLEDYLDTPFVHTKSGFHANENYEFITDQFAISSTKVMDEYCSLYCNLEKYYQEGLGETKHGWVGERLITYHLNSKGIKFKNIDPSKFDIDILKL